MPDGETVAAGAVANDGSVVEIYRRLPVTDEIDRIGALLGPNSSVLDLGAGAGRIADPLCELGHQVTAVDDSAQMLAQVQRARTVLARIEELRLPDEFDAVLLASRLINYPGNASRRGMLATVAHHLKPTGKAIIQWAPPQWFESRPPGRYQRVIEATVGTMTIHKNRGGLVDGEFTLECDGRIWREQFRAEHLPVAKLKSELHRAGLKLGSQAPETMHWLTATRRPSAQETVN